MEFGFFLKLTVYVPQIYIIILTLSQPPLDTINVIVAELMNDQTDLAGFDNQEASLSPSTPEHTALSLDLAILKNN